jgi:hypothetical protein
MRESKLSVGSIASQHPPVNRSVGVQTRGRLMLGRARPVPWVVGSPKPAWTNGRPLPT